MTNEYIFTKMYEDCIWGNNFNQYYKGSSGDATSLNYNLETYIPFLKKFILENNIKTIVDLGSGDFRCGRELYENLDITYYGYDVYKKVIDYLTLFFDKPKYNFIHLDFINFKENIVDADLCIIKDTLQHLSNNSIYELLDYINHKFKYILIINCGYQNQDNTNINNGEWRPLSCDFLPLKKYNPIKLFNYNTKEVSLIKNNIEDESIIENVKIVVSRYNENLNWINEYPFNKFKYIVYNKGINDDFNKNNVERIIKLHNIGRCDHTYLYYIIENYNNLSDIIVFFPGSIDIEYKKIKAKNILIDIIKYKKAVFRGIHVDNIKDIFYDFHLEKWKSTHKDNFAINDEENLQLSFIRPFGKWFEHYFQNDPNANNSNWLTFWGIFSISKNDILQHPIERYLPLLINLSCGSNPEEAHYTERSWGVIFGPLNNTEKINE